MSFDLFIITSVINTGQNPWTYTSTRSIYNPEERLSQTIKTIESIRKYTDAKILLIECSYLSKEWEDYLINITDYYINCYDIKEIRDACLLSNKKGFGEVMKMKKAISFINDNGIKFNLLFKISGRYYLNNNFNLDRFSEEEFTFRKNSTVLYGVPYSRFNEFTEYISNIIKMYYQYDSVGLENVLPNISPTHFIDTLGVEGPVAVDNSYYLA
jgi:hypothetical protein